MIWKRQGFSWLTMNNVDFHPLWRSDANAQQVNEAAYEISQLAEQFDSMMGADGAPVTPGHALDFICQIEEQLSKIRAAALQAQ